MKILINGSSLSRGEGSWPYYLMEKLGTGHQLVNLACAGAGNNYLHESTLTEISLRSYDLVVLQWAYVDRIDFRVKDISKFNDTEYTTHAQIKFNHWPSKVIYPINDQKYVQNNWVFGCGYINEPGRGNSIDRLFKEYYEHTTADEHIFSSLIKMISFQDTLKQLKIPYLFTQYRPFTKFERFNHLYKLIDWNNWYSGVHLYTIAKEHNALDDTDHPLPFVHEMYSQHIYNDLVNRGLINV